MARGTAGRASPRPSTRRPTRSEVDRRDLRRVIDDELNRLPEKYRAPVVLCDLEGLTHSEAARRLGLPSGSISRRLGRARTLLRHRLAAAGSRWPSWRFCCLVWAPGRGPHPTGETPRPRAMAHVPRTAGGGLDLDRSLARIAAGNAPRRLGARP